MNKTIVLLVFLTWLILTSIGAGAYLGSNIIYAIFSIVSLLMWGSAWVGLKSYFYIFISTFWMLGFWMKVCIHVIFNLDFGEAIGAFDASATAWDNALIVSTLAMLAALLFRLAQMFILYNRKNHLEIQWNLDYVPQWYIRFSSWTWFVTFAVIVCVAILNFRLGVFQIGLMPHILPFRLNAIIAALFNLGFPIWMATLIYWDVCMQRSFLARFVGIVFEAVLSSVSMLSRGTYVFHTLHYLVSSFFSKKAINLSWLSYTTLLGLIMTGIVFSAVLTTNMRNDFYTPITQNQVDKGQVKVIEKSVVEKVDNPIVQQLSVQKNLAKYKVAKLPRYHLDLYQALYVKGYSESIARVITLAVDRWIGLEGVLAVSSYDRLGEILFINGWLEKESLSNKLVFNYISRSVYVDPSKTDVKNFLFSSTPGLVAMLYYSGSYLMVFIGVILFLSFAGVVEYFISSVIRNPFVVSFLAIFMANMIAQFGGLHQFIILYIEIGMILGAVAFVQNYGRKYRVTLKSSLLVRSLNEIE